MTSKLTREHVLSVGDQVGVAGVKTGNMVQALVDLCLHAITERDEALALLDADGKANAELADKYSIIHDTLAWYEDEPNGRRASAALREVSR